MMKPAAASLLGDVSTALKSTAIRSGGSFLGHLMSQRRQPCLNGMGECKRARIVVHSQKGLKGIDPLFVETIHKICGFCMRLGQVFLGWDDPEVFICLFTGADLKTLLSSHLG